MRLNIDIWTSMSRDFHSKATLAMLYIQEAHAQNEWPITSCRLSKKGLAPGAPPGTLGAPICYNQHSSLAERLTACRDFVNDYSVPTDSILCLVDSVEGNPYQTAYAAWPIRWHVFRQGAGGAVVETVGQPDDGSFDMMQVYELLSSL